MELNAEYRKTNVPLGDGTLVYAISFCPWQENTIGVVILYDPRCNRKPLNDAVDAQRRCVETVSKRHGWDSWVRVKEVLTQFPESKPSGESSGAK